MVERRIFARIKIKMPIKILNPANDKICTAETVDISANGVGLVTEESLTPETTLEMWLDIPDHHEPLHVLGKVVWTYDLEDNIHKRVGVQLGEERLINLGRIWTYKDNHQD